MSIATEITRLQNAKAALKTAINAKGRSITDETLDEYAAEVDLIEAGGGGTTTGDFLVRFIDYDGTVLKEEWVDSGNDATPPTLPDHSGDCSGGGLTFQEWNNAYTNVTRDIDVGATYITTDGKTHAFLTLTIPTTKVVTLNLNKSDGSTLTVDWGDGTTPDTFTNTGNFNTGAHTYANYGDYEVTMWISVGTGSYGFGNGTNTTAFLDGGTLEYSLTKMLVGSNVTVIGAYSLYYCYSLKFVSLPSSLLTLSGASFSYCYSFKSINVPKNLTSNLGTYTFQYCSSLVTAVLPSNQTLIDSSLFYYCYSLESIVIPVSVQTIGNSSFANCKSLEIIKLPPATYLLNYYAFENCESLHTFIFEGTLISLSGSCFSGCYSLRIIDLPASTVFNNTNVFVNDHSLSKIRVRQSSTSIVSGCFTLCYSIIEYDFSERTTIPSLGNVSAFSGINKMCKIKVPVALEAAWKAATNWATYADYIVGV